jgi:hypothetical protein
MKLLFLSLFACVLCPIVACQQQDEGSLAPSELTPPVDLRNLRGIPVDLGSIPVVEKDHDRLSATGSARRHTLQARTTLVNVDVDDLLPEHIIFFEETWIRAFNKVFFGTDSPDRANDISDVSVPRLRSFVVEDILNEKNQEDPDGGRALKKFRRGRRPRGIKSYKWFDIWALMETSCNLCGKDDDRRLILNRSLKKDESILRELEAELCKGLRSGPFSCFDSLEECRVIYVEE